MTRTACCFLALGFSVAAFAAACGDDDDGGGGTGGNGGNGGTGASGGAGGNAGSAGAAGEAGTGNLAGAGGVAGSSTGGTAGSTAGTAGSSAGTAGSGTVVDPDGGVDSGVVDEPDSGVVDPIVDAGGNQGPVDSGVNGDCTGFVTGIANIDGPTNQEVVIARVIFNDDDTTATVVLRVTATGGFTLGGGQQLCWDGTDEACTEVDDNVAGPAPVNTELAVVIGTVDDPVSVDEGEVLFTNDFPSTDPGTSFAYLNWEDHPSADPQGAAPTLETMAGAFWTPGDSVQLAGAQNAIFVNGDSTTVDGYGVCTADEF